MRNLRIYGLPFEKEKTKKVYYVEEDNSRISGVFETREEAALFIYNLHPDARHPLAEE